MGLSAGTGPWPSFGGPEPRYPWLRATWWWIIPLCVANAVFLGASLPDLFAKGSAQDWDWLVKAGQRILVGEDPYFGRFRWSPLMAWAFVPISAMGIWAWRALHLLALLALPRRTALVALVSWPFWFDLSIGNVNAFGLVLATGAVAGRRWATLGFLALAVLVPRPLYLPVLLWLLWRRPAWRVPFALILITSLLALIPAGFGSEWLASFLAAGEDMRNAWNLGPSRFLGWAWLPAGLALATWLTWKGRLGLASLAASPYLLPYYFLMGMVPDAVETDPVNPPAAIARPLVPRLASAQQRGPGGSPPA